MSMPSRAQMMRDLILRSSQKEEGAMPSEGTDVNAVLEAAKRYLEAKSTGELLKGVTGGEKAEPPAQAPSLKETAEVLKNLTEVLVNLAERRKADPETVSAINEVRQKVEELGKELGVIKAERTAQPTDRLSALKEALDTISFLNQWMDSMGKKESLGAMPKVEGETTNLEALKLQRDMLQLRLEHDIKMEEMRQRHELALEEIRRQSAERSLQERRLALEAAAKDNRTKKIMEYLEGLTDSLAGVFEEPTPRPTVRSVDCPDCGGKGTVHILQGVHGPGDKVACSKCGAVHDIVHNAG